MTHFRAKKINQETGTRDLTTAPQIEVNRKVQRALEGGKFGDIGKKKDKT